MISTHKPLVLNRTNLIMNFIHNIFLMGITKPGKEAILQTVNSKKHKSFNFSNDINQS